MQDVWVRWPTTDRQVVRDPAAFLVTTTTRLAINVVQSARARRETGIAAWLPEPADTDSDPGQGVERGEALQSAIMVLLETLSARERAAYVRREAFEYSYRDIATLLRLGEANARQLVTRARQHVVAGRRTPSTTAERRRLLGQFVHAVRQGDAATLERIFAPPTVLPSAPARLEESGVAA